MILCVQHRNGQAYTVYCTALTAALQKSADEAISVYYTQRLPVQPWAATLDSITSASHDICIIVTVNPYFPSAGDSQDQRSAPLRALPNLHSHVTAFTVDK